MEGGEEVMILRCHELSGIIAHSFDKALCCIYYTPNTQLRRLLFNQGSLPSVIGIPYLPLALLLCIWFYSMLAITP